jgi:large subunit ribosomal protein L24
MKKLKIKKGDMVFVITGNDKDLKKPRRVLEVYPDKMRVLVEGVNVRIRHTKPSQQNQKGGRLSKEMPIHYSNVMISDSDRNPTRIGIKRENKDTRSAAVRYAKSNGKDL